MALRPGPGGGGGGGGFMFPVAGGIGPPQGMMPMQQQQQGFPMVSLMSPGMQGMMQMNFGSQMPAGSMPMQGGMQMGPMQSHGMPYMGQSPYMRMRQPTQQYSQDMQKQFAEEQQKRFEQQQKMLEEDRKRRQFEEQKQKLRLLSSVKPKTGEKSRDDALEAIKGNLDGFSRDAKMHPTPVAHPKNPDYPTPSRHPVSVSQTSAFLDDEEFSDFMQGPVQRPSIGPPISAQLFQASHLHSQAGDLLSEQAVSLTQPCPPAQIQGPSGPHGSFEQASKFSTSSPAHSVQKSDPSLELTCLTSCDLRVPSQIEISFKPSECLTEVWHKPTASTSSRSLPSLLSHNGGVDDDTATAVEQLTSGQNQSMAENGTAVFPSQEQIQPMAPAWLYNDGLVPDLYKRILETTMTPTGIDTAKLYPILISSGLPRETLGQIWGLANRTTPGKLTKEELYTVLAMIAISQRGAPAMNPDVVNQLPAAPVPTLAGFPMTMPVPVHQQTMLPSGPAVSRPLSVAQPTMGMNVPTAMGGASNQPIQQNSSGQQNSSAPHFIMPTFSSNQAIKPEDDDFQEFQDASKSGSIDDSFTDFQTANSQPRISAPSLLLPLSGVTPLSPADKYAAFKGITTTEKSSESTSTFADFEDKYHAFRQLAPSESKSLGEGFADFRSDGTDDGFTDFKTADSISPLDPPSNDSTFCAPFPPLTLQQKSHTQPRTLNLKDLDLFSAANSPGDSKPPSFPASLSSTKSASFPAPPLPSSVTTSVIPGKSPSLTDEFGDFNLFGGPSNSGPVVGQDDFADFMAFNNSTGSSEQKTEDMHSTLNQETRVLPSSSSSTSIKSGQLSTADSSSKYDIFKQLSLDASGTGYEELRDAAPSFVKNDDDFADFQPNRFSSFSNSEKSLVDKVSAFKQTKEDSASVKSLDLPSIGGSSVGKEDSEDALSVQFDMKLADVGGDLKHVMSDSSLDLPTVSGQHPPAAEFDDFKCIPYGNDNSGSAVSSLTSYDWSEKEDDCQSRKLPSFFLSSERVPSPSTAILQKKQTFFGSSESITMTTTISKVTTFSSEDATLKEVTFPCNMDPAAAFEKRDIDEFGDFAVPGIQGVEGPIHSQETVCPGLITSGFPSEEQKESTDDFGEFQREKPKMSKFDFLLAHSQGKVKSSEEMIKSELATFDLCVQGSHKRSLSLGDREIGRSSPSPSLEQPFRDRSNTLSDKPTLPVIRDKYKDLTGEVEESERYGYEWQRCLESALQVIKKANDTLNGISSSSVCTEVIQSVQGMEYLVGVVEVYRVTKRVELGIKATAVCSEKLQQLLKDIDKIWNNLIGFMSLAALTPDESALDFSSCMLRPGIKNAQNLACGVCLLNVDSRSKKEDKPAEEPPKKAFNSETDNFKLAYGGHQYHASCANFWINCVEPKPPGLILPDLL
ncbi:synergin gamma isoform X3 [Ambystoma mexicanum]|uniref:synergin gamma isoform X3 n=1 Tax=Ambystoma mexicanum TaxID=8296 RepID=UPI0037E8283F